MMSGHLFLLADCFDAELFVLQNSTEITVNKGVLSTNSLDIIKCSNVFLSL